jgi:alpha-mannosidase
LREYGKSILVANVYICDMLENNLSEINTNNNKVTVEVKNFEIITLKIRRQ